MTSNLEINKLISKTAYGSVYISAKSLRDYVSNFVISYFLNNNVSNFELINVDFEKFESETNFQINIFLKSKKIINYIEREFQIKLQNAIITFLNKQFQIDVLTVNIIIDLNH